MKIFTSYVVILYHRITAQFLTHKTNRKTELSIVTCHTKHCVIRKAAEYSTVQSSSYDTMCFRQVQIYRNESCKLRTRQSATSQRYQDRHVHVHYGQNKLQLAIDANHLPARLPSTGSCLADSAALPPASRRAGISVKTK